MFSVRLSKCICRCFIGSRYYSDGSSKKLLQILGTMHKQNTGRITEAQRQRMNIKKKSEKYAPSTVYLQVLGSGAYGASNTLYLFTDQKRYLFNCGESTQRLAHEQKVKLSKLEHVFITSKSWKNIGGLPGLSLTLQDVGVPNITLHGPQGLDVLYSATKRFVNMKEMNVTMAKCDATEDYEDSAINVKYVLLDEEIDLMKEKPVKRPKLHYIVDKAYKEFICDDTNYYSNDANTTRTLCRLNQKRKLELDQKYNKQYGKKEEKLPSKSVYVAYICTLKKRLGTLDLAKCVERGVTPGPMLGELKRGMDICLPDGTIVLSKDVKTPDDPGPVFIVLEIPEISYLCESQFEAHFAKSSNPPENVPAVVVHLSPPHVLHAPEYISFMAKFGESTQHLVVNEMNSCLGSEAVHRTQHKLHILDPHVFPLLKDYSIPPHWDPPNYSDNAEPPENVSEVEAMKNTIALAQFENIITTGLKRPEPDKFAELERLELNICGTRTLDKYHLRPKQELDRSLNALRIQEYIREAMSEPGFNTTLQTFMAKAEEIRAQDQAPMEFPKVLFLGTGSCLPSKTRNTSAILIYLSEEQSILLDCGEGTFCQLVRFFGPKNVNNFLRTLKAVYISHLHADHHLGLIGVLQARRRALEEISMDTADNSPLYLLAPGQIMSWLLTYDQHFQKIRKLFTIIPNQGLNFEAAIPSAELTPAVLAAIGLQDVKTCYVSHCPNAFGVSLYLNNYKITYSGDTLPCNDLLQLGQDSNLLIHEATMEDDLYEEARTKMHSTMSQAAAAGRQMNAGFTILTHFSQRYARIPRLNPSLLQEYPNVGIAFDNMLIRIKDLPLLPHMYSTLVLMFAEHYADMEMKAAIRSRQKEASPRRVTTPVSYRESNSSRLRKLARMSVVDTSDNGRPTKINTKNIIATRSHSLPVKQEQRPITPPKWKPVKPPVLALTTKQSGNIKRNPRSISCSPSRHIDRPLAKMSTTTVSSSNGSCPERDPPPVQRRLNSANARGSKLALTVKEPETMKKSAKQRNLSTIKKESMTLKKELMQKKNELQTKKFGGNVSSQPLNENCDVIKGVLEMKNQLTSMILDCNELLGRAEMKLKKNPQTLCMSDLTPAKKPNPKEMECSIAKNPSTVKKGLTLRGSESVTARRQSTTTINEAPSIANSSSTYLKKTWQRPKTSLALMRKDSSRVTLKQSGIRTSPQTPNTAPSPNGTRGLPSRPPSTHSGFMTPRMSLEMKQLSRTGSCLSQMSRASLRIPRYSQNGIEKPQNSRTCMEMFPKSRQCMGTPQRSRTSMKLHQSSPTCMRPLTVSQVAIRTAKPPWNGSCQVNSRLRAAAVAHIRETPLCINSHDSMICSQQCKSLRKPDYNIRYSNTSTTKIISNRSRSLSEERLDDNENPIRSTVSTASYVIETNNSKVAISNTTLTVMTLVKKESQGSVGNGRELRELTRRKITDAPRDLSISCVERQLTQAENSEGQSISSMSSSYQKKVICPHKASFNNGRYYKPSLEDIKSSCFLLRKPDVYRKSPAIDEAGIQRRIIEAKRKFSSKEYILNSKYDKIEGLNWISWK